MRRLSAGSAIFELLPSNLPLVEDAAGGLSVADAGRLKRTAPAPACDHALTAMQQLAAITAAFGSLPGIRRETSPTQAAATMDDMSEEVTDANGNNRTDAPDLREFYVRRVNWLITTGRSDLIDEIADDCERRSSSHSCADATDAHSRPNPVERGTKAALSMLRHSAKP